MTVSPMASGASVGRLRHGCRHNDCRQKDGQRSLGRSIQVYCVHVFILNTGVFMMNT